jgi:exonuclease III
VSTLGNKNAKTYVKIEGITSKHADIIFISDVRAKQKGKDIEKLMGLNRNGCYKLYLNSTKESRGVGIAIKRCIAQEVKKVIMDFQNENYILLDIVIKGKRLTLGAVYGPNENNVGFYNKLREDIESLGQETIIGGDFNTIQCHEQDELNVDRVGRGRIPNIQNSRIINTWIAENFLIDPFRTLYPLQRETSYIPFRAGDGNVRREYGTTRLDFYLISASVLCDTRLVVYEDRLGTDFDHKEVTLKLGKSKVGGKMIVRDKILEDPLSGPIGLLSLYETVSTHLVDRDIEINRIIGRLDTSIRERELLDIVILRTGVTEFTNNRIIDVERSLKNCLDELPNIITLLERDISCSYRVLYEIAVINLKNRLMARQAAKSKESDLLRSDLVARCDYMKEKFGENSVQFHDERGKLLRFDDQKLKERATKFREF